MFINEWQERYDIPSKKSIYDRLSALNVKLPKKNRKSYATPEIVEQLDRLHEHLNSGGTLSNFMDGEITSYTVMDSDDDSHVSTSLNDDSHVESSSITTIHNDTDIVSDSQQVVYIEREAPWHAEQQDPLMPNRLLAEAADKGYILTSKQIKDILGIKPKGSSFTRLGFTFTKIGKDGIYSSWRVERN